MRIAIDARWIFPEISGIGNYTRQLIQQLIQLDSENDYLILFHDPSVMCRTVMEAGIDAAPNFEAVRLPYGVFSLPNQVRMPFFLRRKRVDIFHSPNYMIPLLAFPRRHSGRVKVVTTIHDLIPLVFPNHAPKSKKSRMFPLFKRIMHEVGMRSDRIITVSKASRKDIIQYLAIPPDRENNVVAIYNGVADTFASLRPTGMCAAQRRHGRILYVGRSDPYKNLQTLIHALAIAREQTGEPLTLVIAGTPDARYTEPADLVRELQLEEAVTWTGYLSDENLAAEYAKANMLVQPSLYEGFGLQIVEAMASGTPVICSNRGALVEVAGDAALLVDPEDRTAMGAAIARMTTDHELASKLSQLGLDRVALFSWKEAARATLAVYNDLCRSER